MFVCLKALLESTILCIKFKIKYLTKVVSSWQVDIFYLNTIFFQTNFKEKNKVWDRGTGKPVLANQIASRTTPAACSNQKPWMTIVFWRAAHLILFTCNGNQCHTTMMANLITDCQIITTGLKLKPTTSSGMLECVEVFKWFIHLMI